METHSLFFFNVKLETFVLTLLSIFNQCFVLLERFPEEKTHFVHVCVSVCV